MEKNGKKYHKKERFNQYRRLSGWDGKI